MDYRDYADEQEHPTSLRTGIHTRINNQLRISSCFRWYGNEYFESWNWETFLWNGDNIEKKYDTLTTADQVVNLHTKILKEHLFCE